MKLHFSFWVHMKCKWFLIIIWMSIFQACGGSKFCHYSVQYFTYLYTCILWKLENFKCKCMSPFVRHAAHHWYRSERLCVTFICTLSVYSLLYWSYFLVCLHTQIQMCVCVRSTRRNCEWVSKSITAVRVCLNMQMFTNLNCTHTALWSLVSLNRQTYSVFLSTQM